MVSIIIPTLSKSPDLENSLRRYSNYDLVDEIILICNGFSWELNLLKVRTVVLPRNIYVNPSWNLGVELSRSTFTILLNDDFEYDIKLHKSFLDAFNLEKIGVVGLRFTTSEPHYILKLERRRNFGWGTCIGFRTSDYVAIPNYLKIYCGDDFIFYNSVLNNFAITSYFPIKISVSSDNPIFSEIKHNDVQMYRRLHWFDKYRRDFKLFWLNIFGAGLGE